MSDANKDSKVTIDMTPYAWSRLLDILYDELRVCNRHHGVTIELYEIISTQLNDGHPIKIIHRDHPDPKYRPNVEHTVGSTTPSKKLPWWKRIF